jgi:hypothetical protein
VKFHAILGQTPLGRLEREEGAPATVRPRVGRKGYAVTDGYVVPVAGIAPDVGTRTSSRHVWRVRAASVVVMALGTLYLVMDLLRVMEPSGPVPGWAHLLVLVGALVFATYAAVLAATTRRRT